jgi:hypothetical protein
MNRPWWLSAEETAAMLGVHMNTVKRIPPEQLPYMRIGSRGDRRYRITDIETYIEMRTVRTS